MVFYEPVSTIGQTTIAIHPWDSTQEDVPSLRHLCSQECVLKEVSAFMNPSQGLSEVGGTKPVVSSPEPPASLSVPRFLVKCEHCGHVASSGVCANCGAPIRPTSQSANAVESQPGNEPSEERQNNSNPRLCGSPHLGMRCVLEYMHAGEHEYFRRQE